MAEPLRQPKAGDAVLGDRHSVPIDTAVLGGLSGVKQRLGSSVVEQRIAVLPQTLKYGQAGLDLVIQALQDSSEQVQQTAYLLLRQQSDPKAKQALQKFNPYRFFGCIRTLAGCYGPVYCIAISPDGQTLVSGGEDGTIKLWHLHTRELIGTLVGHTSPVLSVVISSDGQTLASGGEDGTIKLWHLNTRVLVRTLILAYACSSNAIAISSDGKILYVSDFSGLIQLWHLDTGEKMTTLEVDSYQIAAITISREQTLNRQCRHGPIKLWDLPTVGLQCTVSKCHLVAGVALSPDRQILATGTSAHKIQLWHLQTGEKLHTLEGHIDRITAIAISPDGQTLISASTDWIIKLWNLPTGEALHTFSGPASSVTSLAISPNGHAISGAAVYPYTCAIKFWDVSTGKELSTLKAMGTSIALSSDGKTLASIDANATIEIWNLEVNQKIRTIDSGVMGDNWSIVISPDGHTLIVSGNWDRTIKLWDLHIGCEKTRLRHAQMGGVSSIAISPDGQFLASTGTDKMIKLWDLNIGENLQTLSGHAARVCAVAISSDGKTLASASFDKAIKLWSLHTGKAIITLEGHQAGVMSLAFSPDGKTLASGSFDKTIKLWNLIAGREILTLEHLAQVNVVVFSPDGQTLISGSNDKTIKVWGVK